MTYEETAALSRMTEALSILHTQYASVSNPVQRRDQIKQFMASLCSGLVDLACEDGADREGMEWVAEPALEAIEAAFVDAIDAYEMSGAIDVRQYSTLHTYRGSVVG